MLDPRSKLLRDHGCVPGDLWNVWAWCRHSRRYYIEDNGQHCSIRRAADDSIVVSGVYVFDPERPHNTAPEVDLFPCMLARAVSAALLVIP